MVLHNPNNWHWVNKDASGWANNYFQESLVGTSCQSSDGVSVQIDKVLAVKGDVDVSQRKGKVITLFDVELQLEFSGQLLTGDSASGTITIPEVAHDTEPSEYVFDISIYSDSTEKSPIKELVRTTLATILREKLSKFSGALMEQHGKDIQHTRENDPQYRVPSAESSSRSAASSRNNGSRVNNSSNQPSNLGTSVNTTSITRDYEFQASAKDLYEVFTVPQRIAVLTRQMPQVFDPRVNGSFELFSGGVQGKFVELEDSKRLRQKWRLSSWPEGHFSDLLLVFDEGVNVTTLRLAWDGVPIGQEETVIRNFEEYYVRSIKLNFGFGAIL